MFDISWGEIAILGAVGVAVTGKRDLPMACRFVGQQLGRVVGLLQGARARADRFAHHNELKALQNELRSGLRELDQVKTELAVAASTQGVMGRNLGAMTRSVNKSKLGGISSGNKTTISTANQTWKEPVQEQPRLSSPPLIPPSATGSSTMSKVVASQDNKATNLSLSDFDFHVEDSPTEKDATNDSLNPSPEESLHRAIHEPELSPAAQSERAVMEEEWTKQGIGFKAQAEQGSWIAENTSNEDAIVDTTRATGSELLEHLERQCLIFDQYDRVVGEQEKEMEERVERIQNERKQKTGNGKKEQ